MIHDQAADCLDLEVDNYHNDAPATVSHEVALRRFGASILAFLSWRFGADAQAFRALGAREGISVKRVAKQRGGYGGAS